MTKFTNIPTYEPETDELEMSEYGLCVLRPSGFRCYVPPLEKLESAVTSAKSVLDMSERMQERGVTIHRNDPPNAHQFDDLYAAQAVRCAQAKVRGANAELDAALVLYQRAQMELAA